MSIKMNDSKEVETQSICQTTEKPKKRKKNIESGNQKWFEKSESLRVEKSGDNVVSISIFQEKC